MSRIADLLKAGLLVRDVALGPFTTYKSGGPAALFIEPGKMEDLEELTAAVVEEGLPVLVLGRGSNLLVSDKGFGGLVVKLGPSFSWTTIEGDIVTSGAATPLPRLARGTVEKGRRGLEFFVGIPGSVGGAVRQNAGCFGAETTDRLIEVQLVDLAAGGMVTVGADRLDLSYRHSNIAATQVVLSASFSVDTGDEEEGLSMIREITRWRKENQPGGTFNAGSVFKNPPGTSAGELIDGLGLKGLGIGEVRVSDRHANFFVAGPSATSSDILALINLVKDRVAAVTGTILEPEIQMVGFDE